MGVYLDHAASTPLRPEAREAWLAAAELTGNASSVHGAGQAARRVLEDARERIAAVLGCDPIEVVFTSGGTESVNLGVKGLWWAREPDRSAIVLPDGEHHATLDTVEWLAAAQGAQVRPVPLDPEGAIDADAFAAVLPGAALATALVANNEVGTVSDVARLAAAAADAAVPLHLDAVGAIAHTPIDFAALRGTGNAPHGLVAASVSGHKVGAPVGTGALVVSRFARIGAVLHGGGQQRGLRSGTPDVAGAAALAVALELTAAERDAESPRLTALAGRLADGIRRIVPGARLLGSPDRRLPGHVHVLFPDALGETLLFLLDHSGVEVSTGSACQAGIAEPSHVVMALGYGDREARSVLRITLGRSSTADDVDAFLAALPDAHRRAAASSARAAARS
ncbi:cysteine desulfurase family protein [Microbacterium sp. KSW-18]|uniref:Cysteine desulfurase family protein n=1 Tax=Microbacterium aquilitoris TaxID=3067307 RepID=A0ABU3GKG7_9MICO|nr:cysteine desulfurase family protein [Microbacterium sp. KSW-18]MDT3331195.1 cysteine desulfurase family protein [Microbacterium sp. KSW-18]